MQTKLFHVKQFERQRAPISRLSAKLFHVKQFAPRTLPISLRRPLALLLILALAIPLIAACDVADQPDGWAAPTLDPIQPETRLIAPTGEKQVVAVELLDGNLGAALWEFPDDDGHFPGLDDEIKPEAFYADPVWVEATDEWLLAGYQDGVLYAVRRDGESARAVFDSEYRFVADFLVDGTTVYIADTGYHVYAIDIEQPGQTIWTWDGGSELQIWGGPAIVETDSGRLLVVAGLDGRVTALQLDGDAAGQPAWTFAIEAGIAGSIAAADGVVYVGGLDRVLYGLDAASGARIWSAEASHWIWGTPLIRDGAVYITDLRGNVYAFDARTGAARWLAPFAADDRIRAQPLYVELESSAESDEDADQTTEERPPAILVIVARGGDVFQINAADGRPLWQFKLEGAKDLMANAILRDDRILVSDEDGSLYAVLLGARQAVRLYPPN